MAVARKVELHHILLGEVGESFGGHLTAVGTSTAVQLPTPVDVTVGSDGLLVTARSTLFGPSVTLDQWPGQVPYVSGEVYFIPWDGIRGLDSGATESSNSAVVVHHLDGFHTDLELATVSGPGRLLDACRGLPRGSEHLTSDPTLWADIARILVDTPFRSEEEILQTLREDYGWTECTRTVVDAILWDSDISAYFHAHVWFVDEEAYESEGSLGDFPDLVLDLVASEPMTAEEVLVNLESEDLALADIYDVLYDPNVPVFTRTRAWYLDHEVEGEKS